MDALKKDLLRLLLRTETATDLISEIKTLEKEACQGNSVDTIFFNPHIQVGMYVFANRQFSDNPKDFDDLLGVVAWVNQDKYASKGHRGMILTLDEKELTWKGAEEYCQNYDLHGVTIGEGKFVGRGRMQKILKNVKIINFSLQKIRREPLGKALWTSSESGSYKAWVVPISQVNEYLYEQERYAAVRCVLYF